MYFNFLKAVVILLLITVSSTGHTQSNETSLMIAIADGDLEAVNMLLNTNVDINFQDSRGNTPLILGAMLGNEEIFKSILDHQDVDVSIKSDNGLTALLYAKLLRRKDFERGQRMVDLLKPHLSYELHRASMYGLNDLIENILTQIRYWDARDGDVSEIINSKDTEQSGYEPISHDGIRTGNTPIMTALSFGTQVPKAIHMETIKLLAEPPSIDFSVQNNYGRTVLIMATTYNPDAVPIILSKNSDVNINARDNEGNTALGIAMELGHEDIANTITSTISSQRNNFFEAVKRSDIETVNKLVGTYINNTDSDGNTALIEASRRGNTRVVRRLLSHPNVRVNEQNSSDNTALTAAVIGNHSGIVQLLLEHPRIRLNILAGQGRNALMWAAFLGEIDVVNMLIDKGANLNMQDRFLGNTALMFAAESGKDDVVKAIINSGQYIENHRNRSRQSAEMLAQRRQYDDIASLLNNFFRSQGRR